MDFKLFEKQKYYLDIALTISLAMILVVISFIETTFWYNLGLGTEWARKSSFENQIGIACVFLFIIIVMLLIQIGRILVLRKRAGATFFYIRMFLFFLSVLMIFTGFMLIKPGYFYFTKGFLERMRKEADVPAIREWLKTSTLEDGDILGINKDKWPDVIKNLSPNYFSIRKSDIGEKYIRIGWGGGIEDYGLVVGPSTMKIPEPHLKPDEDYCLKLADGAYVWYEMQ